MISLLKHLPTETRFDFLRYRGIALLIAGLVMLASLVAIGTRGLNFGIDFAGGVLIEIETAQTADLADLRRSLNGLGLGDVGVTTFGDTGRDVVIRLAQQAGGDAAQGAALETVKQALGPGIEYRRVEVVGPKVGAELVRDGAMAIGFAILAIAAYVWLRFEWQFAMGALLALIHDVITTIGLFALFQLEFDLTIVAALLSIAGYSINDTVVNYDRVRENLRRYKKTPLVDLLNISFNQVFIRTMLTSGSTAIAVLAILFFGGPVLWGFALAFTWGVFVGTFSSIFICAPVLLYFKIRPEEVTAEEATAEEAAEVVGEVVEDDRSPSAARTGKPRLDKPQAP